MRSPQGSLLEQTSQLVVRRQIDYTRALGLPWGISESAHNVRDREFTYQYSNFGIPGLGLKRGLGADRVIAPYATALATMVDPNASVANFAQLDAIGARGRYGYYEALDFTPGRFPAEAGFAIVQTYMAHHQGMTIVAIADALLGAAMRARFHSEPMVQATELILQERPPRDLSADHQSTVEVQPNEDRRDGEVAGVRRYAGSHQPTPATQMLSNGRFTTMVTAAGSGYCRAGAILR